MNRSRQNESVRFAVFKSNWPCLLSPKLAMREWSYDEDKQK